MGPSQWYQNIIKPTFAPPAYVFGIAWSILYPIIFISFGYTGYLVISKKISKHILVPLIINLISNLLFSPIQFGLKSNLLAAIDITIVLGSLIWFIAKIYPHSKVVAFVQAPYLLWVFFATVLQYSIAFLNK
ncbi:TspO/MBR family protein [Patescibacteria group bacterium]